MTETQRSNKPLVAGVLIVVGVLACAGLVAVVGVLAAIAIPNFVAMQLKAKRAEVPANVEGIRVAELAYSAAFDAYVPLTAAPRAARNVSKEAVGWQGDPAWKELGWSADGDVRGVYWVELTPGDFTVHGVCDVDGDGERAEYVATRDGPVDRVTRDDVY